MKKVAKSLVIVGAMLAAGSTAADMFDVDFKPFMGVDYLQAWTPAKGTLTTRGGADGILHLPPPVVPLLVGDVVPFRMSARLTRRLLKVFRRNSARGHRKRRGFTSIHTGRIPPQ